MDGNELSEGKVDETRFSGIFAFVLAVTSIVVPVGIAIYNNLSFSMLAPIWEYYPTSGFGIINPANLIIVAPILFLRLVFVYLLMGYWKKNVSLNGVIVAAILCEVPFTVMTGMYSYMVYMFFPLPIVQLLAIILTKIK
ncbi:MAG: hypothetical protein ACW98Y_01980 [Candidatus Thorarchaeota archaeon]